MIDTIIIKWDILGAELAKLFDEEQGAFFRGFAYELSQYTTHYARQMQMMYVRDKLTKDEQKTLSECLPCLWYEDKKDK